MKKAGFAKKALSTVQEDESLGRSLGRTEMHAACHGIMVGRLIALNGDALPVVRIQGEAGGKPLVCRSIIDIDERSLGREVVVQYEEGDVSRPIVMGILKGDRLPVSEQGTESGQPAKRFIEIDGDRLLLAGDREIVLQCGDARITLTKAGKILIHGNYVLTRSRGACKLKGASVDIN